MEKLEHEKLNIITPLISDSTKSVSSNYFSGKGINNVERRESSFSNPNTKEQKRPKGKINLLNYFDPEIQNYKKIAVENLKKQNK